ncbi:MAG: hypothetical protein ABSF53_22865, partial [Terracidiphilus sp.]
MRNSMIAKNWFHALLRKKKKRDECQSINECQQAFCQIIDALCLTVEGSGNPDEINRVNSCMYLRYNSNFALAVRMLQRLSSLRR